MPRKRRNDDVDNPQMLFSLHLRELRNRLAGAFAVFVAGSVAGYLVYDQIFAVLQAPLGAPLYYTSPGGGFAVMLGICAAVGLVVAIPVLVYQLLIFAAPVTSGRIRPLPTLLVALAAFALACAGATFAVALVLPGILRFFTGFQTAGIHALITAGSYFDLVTKLMLAFALIFQLPLLLWAANSVRPLPPRGLLRAEKWVVLGSLGVAFLVPFSFDLMTQLLIALPIILLYNLSIAVLLGVRLLRKWQRPRTIPVKDSVVQTPTRAPRPPENIPDPTPRISPRPVFIRNVDGMSRVRKAAPASDPSGVLSTTASSTSRSVKTAGSTSSTRFISDVM